MPNDTIPDWAREMAAEAHQMLVASVEPNIETIARALVAARRRGLELAAKYMDRRASEIGYDTPTTGMMARIFEDEATAIRKLMEGSDGE